MNRLSTLVKFEFKLQWEYGLIVAGLLMSTMWLLMLSFFPASSMAVAIPLVLLSDLATMGYMFIASMIYFEKGQGSIHVMMVTPVSIKEYLQSKIIALLIYVMGVSFIVVQGISIIKGLSPHYGFLVISIMMTAIVHMLLGVLFAAKFNSFSSFLFPTGLIFMVLMIPMLGFLNIPELQFMEALYYLWPTHGLILLLRGIYISLSSWQVIYALLYNGGLIYCLYRLCIKAFNQTIVGREGDIDG